MNNLYKTKLNKTTKVITVTGNRVALSPQELVRFRVLENLGYTIKIIVK